jgi:hypothetical protein
MNQQMKLLFRGQQFQISEKCKMPRLQSLPANIIPPDTHRYVNNPATVLPVISVCRV